MAKQGMRLTVSSDFKDFENLRNYFPELSYRVLAKIASQGKLTLKGMLASGQYGVRILGGRDVKGRRMISANVRKGNKGVEFKSYPLNPFERGRTLRSGKKEKGRRIITGKFKAIAASRLQQWANTADSEVLSNYKGDKRW